MKPEAVLFDMDGTLFDSERLWTVAIEELAARHGAWVSAELRKSMVGQTVAESMRLLHEGIGLPLDDLETSVDWIYERVAQLFTTRLQWRPGARELLGEVRAAGLPTALVTSTWRQVVDIALETLGRHNFDVEVCGDEVEFGKPHPYPYQRAAQLLGVQMPACVAVEDSPTGVASASAAGARVLAIPHHVMVEPAPRVTIASTLSGVRLSDLAALRF